MGELISQSPFGYFRLLLFKLNRVKETQYTHDRRRRNGRTGSSTIKFNTLLSSKCTASLDTYGNRLMIMFLLAFNKCYEIYVLELKMFGTYLARMETFAENIRQAIAKRRIFNVKEKNNKQYRKTG